MKFIIVSIVIFCVSGISANPIKEISRFTKGMADFAQRVAWAWEMHAGFNSKASLEANVIAFGEKLVDGSNLSEWNPDISAKDNLEKYKKDKNATLTENIKLAIDKLIDVFPFIRVFPESHIEARLIGTVKELAKERLKLNFKETLEHGIENWLASLSDLKVSRPEDIVAPALENIAQQIGLSYFDPEKTLQDNVAEIAKIAFDTTYICQ